MNMETDPMICYCSNVRKSQIIAALEAGAKSIKDIRAMTGACTLARCRELSPRGT